MTNQNDDQVTGATEDQLLDYYLLDELIVPKERGYAVRVQGKLLQHNVTCSSQKIYSRAKLILNGSAVLRPAAEFHGIPGSRIGKDQNYAGFWTMVDVAIPHKEERSYIGLANNQVDVVRDHVKGFVMVCERDQDQFEKLSRINHLLRQLKGNSKPFSIISNNDVFEMMERSSWNIFDLDLMQPMPDMKTIMYWADCLAEGSVPGKKQVINLTVTVGRSITDQQHDARIRLFRCALESVGFRELGYSRFRYRDRATPMRSERFILRKKKY